MGCWLCRGQGYRQAAAARGPGELRLACRGAQAGGPVSAAGFTPEVRARAWVLYKLYGIRDAPSGTMNLRLAQGALRTK